MDVDNIDYDNVSEEELAKLRGDNFGEDDPKDDPKDDSKDDPKDDPKDAPKDDPKDGPKPKDIMIPKSRYDSVMGRLKELEREREEWAKGQQQQQQQQQQSHEQPTAEDRLREIDAEIRDAMKDNDSDKVVELMAESRNLTLDLAAQTAQTASSSTIDSRRQQSEYDALVERVNASIPEAVPENEAYDRGFVIETMDLAVSFEARGMSPAAALEKALSYTRPGWDEPRGATGERPPEPKEKRATDVEKNLDTASRQPPRMDSGANSDTAGRTGKKIDVWKLSDEEFEKLTEEELAGMRGDNF